MILAGFLFFRVFLRFIINIWVFRFGLKVRRRGESARRWSLLNKMKNCCADGREGIKFHEDRDAKQMLFENSNTAELNHLCFVPQYVFGQLCFFSVNT